MTGERSIIACDEALRDIDRFDALLDVRSEGEFAEDHLPGAINTPVLHDTERAEVGTMHKQVSAFDARRQGAVFVARNIATIVETQLADRPRQWAPLVYCWRGGQRSAALTHVLNRIGWRAVQLEGGYRAYRRHVLRELQTLPASFSFRVVCGTTGSGKSRLLQELARAGAQVLDLEQLAHHKGSVLGGVPGLPQPSQKLFETRIWSRLRAFTAHRPVFVESESRKVGDLRVPGDLIVAMRASPCLRLELPLRERIRLLRDEYAHYERFPDQLEAQLDCLLPLHGREKIEEWKALAGKGLWEVMVERLLREHYDPAYLRSIQRNFALVDRASVLALDSAAPEVFAAAAGNLARSSSAARP